MKVRNTPLAAKQMQLCPSVTPFKDNVIVIKELHEFLVSNWRKAGERQQPVRKAGTEDSSQIKAMLARLFGESPAVVEARAAYKYLKGGC